MSIAAGEYRGAAHPGGLRLTDRAARLCGLRRGMSILDMGCGAGASVVYLAERYGVAATGIECDESLRGLCASNPPGVRYIFADAQTMCVPDGCADAVFMECALSVMSAPRAALLRARAALRPGGALAVSDVYLKSGRGAPDGAGETAVWDFDELCEMVRCARFDVTLAEDHTPTLAAFRAERYAAGGRGISRAPRGLGYMLVIARRREAGEHCET
ncbi:MAG: methyltransferase domain-containing protein [Oscillospiraceae bacterium]|nr:methyltransferase domain-containing protein [Oscillospiraceae bacterium]